MGGSLGHIRLFPIPCPRRGIASKPSGSPSLDRRRGGRSRRGLDLFFDDPRRKPHGRNVPSSLYRMLHGAVSSRLGGRLAGDGEVSEGPYCFAAPSRDDLMVDGRKVLGGAIRRSGGALLYQGSLLTHGGLQGEDLYRCLSGICRMRILETAEISAARLIGEGRYATNSWNRRR